MANNRELSQFANVVGYDGGNIGIGTDTPGAILEVFHATSNTIVNVKSGDSGAVLNLIDDSARSSIEQIGTSLKISSDTGAEDASSDIRLQVDGSTKMLIDSSGRILQGLTSAKTGFFNDNNAAPVHQIQGSTYYTTAFSIFRDGSGASGPNFILAKGREAIVQDNDILGTISFQGHDGTTELIEGASIQARVNGTPGSNDMPGCLIFSTSSDGSASPTERLRINQAGNVGIKETSPACSLHVDGGTDNLIARFESSDAGAKIELKDNHATSSIEQNSNEFIFNSDSGADDGSSRMSFKIDNSEAMRIDSSGRLLLGTTDDGYSSADNFTIADTGNCGLTIRSGTSSLGTIAFSDATSGTGEYSGFIQYNQSNRHLIFGTESDEHVRIDNNGHLEVDYDSSNNARVQFGFTTGVWITGNSSNGHQEFYTNSAVRIRNLYNGQGTEFANQTKVYPGTDNTTDLGMGSNRYDDVYATNGTIQTSDSRLKHEVQTSVLGIDFVKALRPVSYKWIEGKKVPIVDGTDENGDNIYRSDADGNWVYNSRAGARRHWGFIAQEVKQAVDDAGVDFAGWSLADKDDPDSRQSLRYEEFIAPLTKALQEAIAKIETLETQNTDLLARVTALEGS